PRSRQRLGLHQIVPSPDSVAGHTTIESIIAIHGLGTESPRTWEFKRSEGRVVNWLADEDMLPATVPEARIFTYDWNANYFQDAPVQTLLSHADTLLAHIAETRDVKSRPIIFIASCFGGLVLIEAINRAGQEGSPYRHVLLSTVGIVFEDTSTELIKDLERKHDLVYRRVQKFTEIANADAIRLHLCCFFETKKTEILRRVFPSNWARRFSTRFTHKILVTESSACLLGFPSLPLDVTHSGMNKFDGPGNLCYKLVKDQIRRMANDAWTALNRRQSWRYKEAVKLYREILKAREKILRFKYLSTLNSMNNLATVLSDIKAREKVLKKEYLNTLSSINNLVNILGNIEKVLRKEHLSTLNSISNLVTILSDIEAREKVLKKEHLDTLSSINNLAREKVLGKEYLSTLNSINNLATVLKKIGKYKEAEKIH
ncbi:unnamed protein product, partial [Fusarium fujikuroi]